MDHVRIVDQEFVFGAKRPEIHFAFPLASKPNFLDATLSLVTRPGVTFSEAGCHNVRLYANDIDITEHYAAELRAIIDSWDHTKAKQAYAAAMQRWLRFAEALGAAYGAPDMGKEAQVAAQLAATTPLSSLLTNLGDASHGWSGHLHILNFIHQFDLPYAVSLSDVVHRYSAVTGHKLGMLDINQLTLASGRSPTLDPAFDLAVDHGRGAISIHFELRYHDTLEDQLHQLEKEFAELRDRIDARLDAILFAISSGGPIQRRLTSVEQQIAAAKTLTDQAQRDVASHEAHLKSFEGTITEVRNLVKAL